MNDRKRDLLAGEYVLGTMDSEAREHFAAQLEQDASLQAAVEAWQRRLAGLDAGAKPVDPPAGLWDRIEAALDQAPASASPTQGALLTIHAGDGDWVSLVDGVEKKVLHVDHEAGFECYLLKLAPGARLPAHQHKMVEECIMLEGESWVGDLRLTAGDFHLALPNSSHPEIYSETGSIAYIRGAIKERTG